MWGAKLSQSTELEHLSNAMHSERLDKWTKREKKNLWMGYKKYFKVEN